MRTIPLILAVAALGLAAGCAHKCGYVEIRTEQTPLEGELRVEHIASGQPLNIIKELSRTNPVLVVRVQEKQTTWGPVRQKAYGRRVHVPWKPYAPLVKIFASATVVLPVYFAWHDPTSYGVDNWGMSDFLRDFISWYNWASAIPNGPREIETEEKLIRTRVIIGGLAEATIGIPGRTVSVHIGDKKVASQVTDEKGLVRFDVTTFLTREMAEEDRTIKLVTLSPLPTGEPAETSWTLSVFTMRELMAKDR